MRLFALLSVIPALAASLPVFELGAMTALFGKQDARLRRNAIVQVTGPLSGFLDRDNSTVMTLFDASSAAALGCDGTS